MNSNVHNTNNRSPLLLDQNMNSTVHNMNNRSPLLQSVCGCVCTARQQHRRLCRDSTTPHSPINPTGECCTPAPRAAGHVCSHRDAGGAPANVSGGSPPGSDSDLASYVAGVFPGAPLPMSLSLVESVWLGTSAAQLSALVNFFHSEYLRVDSRNTFALSKSYAVAVALNALPYAIVGVVLFLAALLVLTIRSCCCKQWWYKRSLRPGLRRHFVALGLVGLALIVITYGSLAIMFQAARGIDRSVSGTFKALISAGGELDNGATFIAQTVSNFSQAVSEYVAAHGSTNGLECKSALSSLNQKAQTLESDAQLVAGADYRASNEGIYVVQYIFLAIVILLAVQVGVTYLALVLCQGHVRNCCAVFSRILALIFAGLVMGIAWVVVGLAVAAALALSDACVSQNQLFQYMESQVKSFQQGQPAPPPPSGNAFIEVGLQCPVLNTLGKSYSQAISELKSIISDCRYIIESATGLSDSDYTQVTDQLVTQVEDLTNCTTMLRAVHRIGALSCGSQRDSDISSAFIVFVVGLVLAAIYIILYFLLVLDADLLVWAKMAPGRTVQPVMYQIYPLDASATPENQAASAPYSRFGGGADTLATIPDTSWAGAGKSTVTSHGGSENGGSEGVPRPSAPPPSW